ncbi:MAG: tryptophan--tRNA ligase [Thermoplasmatales archaeon]|nr:tryptophan--tRNA ligase [Thermoplasmatales archaeon]
MAEGFKVTPWEVSGDIDYEELQRKFGTTPLDAVTVGKISKGGEPHFMLRRGVFYSHRDINAIIDAAGKGKPFVLYTGRGPSGDTHLGHLMPWVFCKWLQDTFGVPMYFQMTDDEKFLFRDMTLEETRAMAYDNALDFVALGFDPAKTKIILDTENIRTLYPIALKVAKKITFSTARAVFGFDNSNNIGTIFFTAIQAAPAFLPTEEAGEEVLCLIPCGIDQDPHFRVARDVAPGLGYPKPSLIYCKMFPSLGGGDKMSSSDEMGTIFVTDGPKAVKKKVGRAFTGGRVTVEEQRELGGNPDVCAVYKYNYCLFEPDDSKLEAMERKCRAGEILCGECKQDLTAKINVFLEGHRAAREEAKAHMGSMAYGGFEW